MTATPPGRSSGADDRGTILAQLMTTADAVDRLARHFSTADLRPEEVRRSLEVAATMHNQLGTVRALLAKAVAATRAWEGGKERSAAEFIGRTAGTSVKEAHELVGTGAGLEEHPATAEAARRGALSDAQAHEVTEGARANPQAEERLLDIARQGSLGELKDERRKVEAAADPDPEARRRRIYAKRSLRTSAAADGSWHLHLLHTSDTGARVMAALRPHVDAAFERARRAGRREHPEAYGADGFVAVLLGSPDENEASGANPDDATGNGDPEDSGPATGPGNRALANGSSDKARSAEGSRATGRPKYIVRIDHAALVRGRTEGDEVCEVVGVGPVSVRAVRDLALADDPFWTAIVARGHDVVNVAHLGRHPNAFQRTALEWLFPACAVRGCTESVRVQWDHREDWRHTRHTVLGELDGLCSFHHRLKTTKGWMLIEGNEPKRDFVPPGDPRHPRYRERARPPDPSSAEERATPDGGPTRDASRGSHGIGTLPQ